MTTTTTAPTTVATTTTTKAPVTVLTTQEPTTAPTTTAPPTTTTSPEPPTAPPTTTPPRPATTLALTTPVPTTSRPPEVTTGKRELPEGGEVAIVTQSTLQGDEVTPSAVMVAAELVPVTITDGLSGDLNPIMPLMIPPPDPDSSPLEVMTDSQEAGGVLDTATQTSSGFPLPTPFPIGEPDDYDSPDLTQAPTPLPSQHPQTEAGGWGTDPDVPLWPSEEETVHSEGAVLAENDTATFSAATVLSGDGEVDQASPAYPHLLDTESELDYQYDPADGFLPVSSGASVLLLLLLLLPFLLLLLLPLPLKAPSAPSAPNPCLDSKLLVEEQTLSICLYFPALPFPSATCVLLVGLFYWTS